MRCNTCRGTGRDPLSDNANWLPCPQCGGSGKDRRPMPECANCGERFDPAIPQHFTGLQLCLECQQEHQLLESAPLLLAALRQISQASIGITPTRELLIFCMESASQAVVQATTLPVSEP
jgi:RecJ-like exonuclease